MRYAPLLGLLLLTACVQNQETESFRPNILWITSEDMNAFLGAYGDSFATTPNLDQLAREGLRYDHAYATAPVCSPARSCLITGVYATSMGTQHLRSEVQIPDSIRGFPEYLRELGYYCTNNAKEDYNFDRADIWDESSKTAHWRNRPDDQPFFAVFNFETTHQSRVFGSDSVFHEKFGKQLSESERHDPTHVPIPPYHFDTPEVRKLWARYYDLVTIMDRQVGEILDQLEEDGLADETIIFYYSDHGTGMPRSKRACYDSGLRVPLIIKAPPKWQERLGLQPGTNTAELVSFADFAPTVLSILGIEIPAYMQGHAFLGPQRQANAYVYGHADRVDEAYELTRSVRSTRFRYVRNYYPHLSLIQPNFYTDQSEIMQELYRAKATMPLNADQESMWAKTRAVEELYDTETDPFEVHNLASDPAYRDTLLKMRRLQGQWALHTFDSGLLPEADMNMMAKGSTIYEALREPNKFPVASLISIADQMLEPAWSTERVEDSLQSKKPSVRFWALQVLRIQQWSPSTEEAILRTLSDGQLSVRIAAAELLCARDRCADADEILTEALTDPDPMNRLLAARALELLPDHTKATHEALETYAATNCPQEEWSEYYKLYTCWAVMEALKGR